MNYLLLVCFALSIIEFSQPFDLTVEIKNINELKGNIVISIYNNADDFPEKGKHYKKEIFRIKKHSETLILTNLPAGDYAVAVFHDSNSDGKCNTNRLGLPKEGYGFSNNCKPILSAPSFKCTKFNLSNEKSIIIKLIY